MAIIKNSHPMPDRFRNRWKSLNGCWEFSFDKPVFDKQINVPFSWTCHLSGINEDKKGKGFYRKKLSYDSGENRLFLVLCAVDYYCKIYINDTLVKEHIGGYAPINVDITDWWDNKNENTIVVEACDNSLSYQMRGKQDYGDVRGIWQDVYLEERPSSYIDKFRFITHMDGLIEFSSVIINDYERVVIQVGDEVYESTKASFNFIVQKPILWSVKNPYLYDCYIKLYNKGEVDTIKTYFGIREVGTAKFNGNQYITLNGEPIYINSALDQSYNSDGFFTYPSDDYCREEILRAKNLGLNSLRIHIKTEEKRKLYYADKYGLLIIQDIPCFFGNPTEKAKTYFEKQMYELIDRDINHPSIIYWVIFNETWGLKTFDGELFQTDMEWEYAKETQDWVRKLYHDVKKYDKTRIVEDNSPCNSDHIETDINSWHFYINGYENIKKECERVSKMFSYGSSENYIGNNVMKNVPVLNSECGNYWGVVGNSGDSDISWHYKYMMNEFRLHEKICGFVFTELKDVINEFNGYYRIDNSKKYFGYDRYNKFMSINDLHSEDYLGFDFAPMSTVEPNRNINIPLFISSFTNIHHNEKMQICWEVLVDSVTKSRELCKFGKIPIKYCKYGTTFIDGIDFQTPDEDCIVIVNMYLKDSKENIIMSNFVLIDIQKQTDNLCVSFDNVVTCGFKKVMTVQNGNKFNCIGNGTVEFFVDKSEIKNDELGISILFEASSKEEITKDLSGDGYDTSKKDLDFMKGYKVDRGQNPNSFYMTDEDTYPSKIKIHINDELWGEKELPDSPADSTGCLSWHYQISDDYLDEAGSYGYLCRIDICKSEYEKLPKVFKIKLEVENGLSLYGRKSGAYPVGINIFGSNACDNINIKLP